MLLEDLPTETITHIYLHIPSIHSVLAFSSTCQRLRTIYKSSKRLAILASAAELQYGPTHDIIQLLAYNASQPAHLARSVGLSDSLMSSLARIGRVAAVWESIYPFKKWKTEFAHRRMLEEGERYRFRRALYRLWLYSHAFHNSQHGRLFRVTPQMTNTRAMFLHNFSTGELADMLDVHNVLRDVISNNVCPSNGTIRRKFQKRFPNSNYQLLFNFHLNYPPSSDSSFGTAGESADLYYNHRHPYFADSKYQNKFVPTRAHEPGAEGWGDDLLHYYVVEDMLKLDPAQILHLRDNAPLKHDVEAYTRGLGDWFDNNGETFCQTMAHVAAQRGQDMEELKDAVNEGALGVAVYDL